MNHEQVMASKRFKKFMLALEDGYPRTIRDIARVVDTGYDNATKALSLLAAWGHLDRIDRSNFTYYRKKVQE